MSRININPTRRCTIFSYASKFHHHTLSPCVSSSTPLHSTYFTTLMLNLSHKLLNFTPVSLHNPFPQMGSRYFTLIPSYTPEDASDAFDQTPGGHVSYMSFDDDPHEKVHDFCSDSNQIDKKLTGCVPISSNGEKLYNIVIDCKPNNPENSRMEINLNEAGAQLTTPLVIEVLGSLRYVEKSAFRFFTWAGNQENYSHEPQAYNEMIDILSNTKYKAKQYRIVCDLLDYMKRNDKTCVPVEALLKILRQYADKHLTHLHKFAKKKKVEFKKMQPEIDALNVLLDAFCKCCLVEDAEAMYMKLKNKVKPNASTYNILFFGWCRVRNPSRSMQILDEMIATGYTPENFTYNTAIDTFCKSGMLSDAAELLEFMKSKGTLMSSPTAKTYSIMIIAFARNDKMDECFKLVDDMVTNGCLPDVSTYREMIEGMCSAGKVKAAYKFLEDMKKNGYPPDIVTYNCFLKVLCDKKDSEEAVRLYKNMIEVGCKPSVQTFNMLVMMFFKMGDPNRAFEMWREMDARRCVRDTASYCVMIEGLFGCERTEDACGLLEEVLNKGMKLPFQKFDSFLMQLSSIGDLRAISRLSEHMRKFYNPVMARRFALNQKRKSVSLRGK
ncbi:putative tetratricopeptide-like helical domain superfamily [Helianthus annuus]|uniref:Tetratricopeptide-like helical domain superfamily n=2 Tax=Helianthus annuus TaxID=4232 RepID=A0A9K3EF70_HELAN|nr:pentatricopeptide repeat-containing protein At1g73400, mitochondrial [Helianthus annuus]KAF5772447.1 putative tetratricopeptide-like helical domain superfamily [Helianthus annuus]KAJ0476065.1 putative tetratricopeptide-like helical domain superfamily [Helianthus annuus]KAJ0496869.1 putative tetratricopeptide-like helical domain superfamily [Helianthus annuus]KAJ0662900.1 putative tetratricopeptide-like helical domain superfamily [Helianthus annuus]KAJ0848277.1 putative tetratricopeptide-lik